MPFLRKPYGTPMGPMKKRPSWLATKECFSALEFGKFMRIASTMLNLSAKNKRDGIALVILQD